jgi:hypothetical protein
MGHMGQRMTEYYKNKLQDGLEFQDFVIEQLAKKIGLVISCYSTVSAQCKKGENPQGVEIKNDCNLQKTGNLFLEVEEKTNPDNSKYIPSGIYRNDNSWLYVIGDYTRLYIFSPKYLRWIVRKQKYRLVESGTKTSRGYLMPICDAENYCLKRIEIAEQDDPSPFLAEQKAKS